MEDINNVNYFDPYSTDSDSESSDKKEKFPILNFDSDTYQDIKNEILQLDSDNNEDYDFNDEIEENTFNELDEEMDEILSDQFVEDDRYTLYKGFKETNCNEKHDELIRILETFRNWIQLVAKSNNELQKQQLIWSLLPVLESLKTYLPRDLIYKPIDPSK
ncbi:14840_t:CDS:2 [Racocetra fulgida]|uniref:14839_t:CDS:1 n=1 Tax=Racocetra fulgida TaxID=60492 RepID=A0A9N9FQR5_9GLOM|nr:14839_t:CDS:2 [Racocetra fulgida]CAG8549757.1 14840_t:CDS:2 [Racocetra fulgida]